MNFNDAERIRAKYLAGGISHEALAQEYHVNRSTISRIINREIWRNEKDKQIRRLGACEADQDRNKVELGFSKSADKWGALLYG